MCSPRSAAQLGVAGACLVLIFSLSVLVAGAADSNHPHDQSVSLTPESPSASLGSVEMVARSK